MSDLLYPCIYFIKAEGFDSPIKVGMTQDLERRLESINKWVPYPLEVLACHGIPWSNVNWPIRRQCELFESRFHERYAAYRLHQEWFAPHELLLSDIEAISDGTFDVRCLPNGRFPPHHTARFIQTERGIEIEYSRILTPAQAKRERIAA